MPRRFILARHGQTEWNKSHRFQGHVDISLSEEGRFQAHLLALRLRSSPPEVIYSSPLSRAVFTASEIASLFNLKPVILPELEEINFGSWEGESIIDLEHNFPDEYNRWRSDPFFNPPEGGETWNDIHTRLSRAVDVILSDKHSDILIISHGGIIRALYSVIMGFDPHKVWYMTVDNCAMSGIELIKGRPYLSFTNDNLHILAGEMGILLPVWRNG